MRQLKITVLLLLIFALSSCKDYSFKSETKHYSLIVENASYLHRDFKNEINEEPLKIDAERISLKEIYGILLQTDTSKINFENQQLGAKMFTVKVQSKNPAKSINNEILKEFSTNFNVTIQDEIVKGKIFKISIADSIQFGQFKSPSQERTSTITNNPDSIIMFNVNLQQIAKTLETEYSESSIYEKDSSEVNYSWKKMPFDALKIKMKKDLGLTFEDKTQDVTHYKIMNN